MEIIVCVKNSVSSNTLLNKCQLIDKIRILLSDAALVAMTLQYVDVTFNIMTNTRCIE